MAETVTTLERAKSVFNAVAFHGWRDWKISSDGTRVGETVAIADDVSAAIPSELAIRSANQLLRDAEAKAEPSTASPTPDELGRIAFEAAMAVSWPPGSLYPFGSSRPAWTDMMGSIRRGWTAAAEAVAASVRPQVGLATKRVIELLGRVHAENLSPYSSIYLRGGTSMEEVPEALVRIALRECGMEDKV